MKIGSHGIMKAMLTWKTFTLISDRQVLSGIRTWISQNTCPGIHSARLFHKAHGLNCLWSSWRITPSVRVGTQACSWILAAKICVNYSDVKFFWALQYLPVVFTNVHMIQSCNIHKKIHVYMWIENLSWWFCYNNECITD